MRRCLLRAILVMVVIVIWGRITAQAQRATPTPPDLSGIWAIQQAAHLPWTKTDTPAFLGTFGGAPFRNVNTVFATETPLTPWAQEHCRKVGCGRGMDVLGQPTGRAYLDGEDPTITRCAPHGFPRVLLSGGPFEIFQTPNRLLMHFQNYGEWREIFLDGRGHPPSPNRPWEGHSIGRWDGDTLVVDTVDFHGDPKYKWLDEAGHPHSEQLHVVERIRRADPNTLQIDLRFEDPKAFTAPFTGHVTYELRPNAEIVEYMWNCEDRIFAESPQDAWPYFVGEYPKPLYPPAGTTPPAGSRR